MWLSRRQRFDASDAAWAGYVGFIGRPSLREVRTLDHALNEIRSDDSLYVASPADLAGALTTIGTPKEGEYILLAVEVDAEPLPSQTESCHLLGFDLCDETLTSALLNCGPWAGQLGQFVERANKYGLLTQEDGRLAQALLPVAKPNEPHAQTTIWALYEIRVAPTSELPSARSPQTKTSASPTTESEGPSAAADLLESAAPRVGSGRRR